MTSILHLRLVVTFVVLFILLLYMGVNLNSNWIIIIIITTINYKIWTILMKIIRYIRCLFYFAIIPISYIRLAVDVWFLQISLIGFLNFSINIQSKLCLFFFSKGWSDFWTFWVESNCNKIIWFFNAFCDGDCKITTLLTGRFCLFDWF